MALIKDYEIPGTGVVVPNAYHVVTNVKVEKRMAEILPPPDSSQPDGLTAGDRGPEVYWKAGLIGHATVGIWASKQAREENKKPIGALGEDPAEMGEHCNIGTPGMDHKCLFMIDSNSADNYSTQAYAHLLTLDYYADAVFD